jgi:hypothetical protein
MFPFFFSLSLSQPFADMVLRLPLGQPLTPELGQVIFALWKDPAIQLAFEGRSQHQLGDTLD